MEKALLVEIPRPLASDEEAKVETFMKVRGVTQPVALKFLLGRKMDVERAHLLLNNYQRTILERHFEKLTITDVVKELWTEKMFIPSGKDRNGASLFVIDMTKHEPEKFTRDDTIRLAFFMGEKATERPTVWANGLTIIVNLSGFTWAQFDSALAQDILGLFTENVPARVKNILLFDPPWWISAMVKLVSPFLKEKMRSRLGICDKDSIRRYLTVDQTPKMFGGTLPYDHETFIQHCIEDVGDDVYRKKLHLDEQGREITAVPIEEIKQAIAVVEPAGPKLQLDPELAEALKNEREEAIKAINVRLASLKEGVHENSKAKDPAEFLHLLRYRATRLSLDMSDFQGFLINGPEPNKPSRRSRARAASVTEAILMEHSDDNYDDPEALQERIKQDIKRSIAIKNGTEPEPSEKTEPEESVEDVIPLIGDLAARLEPNAINEELDRRRRRKSGGAARRAKAQPVRMSPEQVLDKPEEEIKAEPEAEEKNDIKADNSEEIGPTKSEEEASTPTIESESVATKSVEQVEVSPEPDASISTTGLPGKRRRRAARNVDGDVKGRRNFHLDESTDTIVH